MWSSATLREAVSAAQRWCLFFLTKTVAGSSFEGWIVRVLSAGKVVRLDASLAELKSFVEKNPAIFDQVAHDPKAGQAKREK
jgi:hypothetical protein